VDDLAGAPLAHLGQHRARHREQAPEVGLEHRAHSASSPSSIAEM
jgi:hypothetical protein